SLRDRLVLPAEEEVDQGAALVRSGTQLVSDLPSLPLPPRLLSREAAPTPRERGGPQPRAGNLGRSAERAEAARTRPPGPGPVSSFSRAAGRGGLRGISRGARCLLRARQAQQPSGDPRRAYARVPGRAAPPPRRPGRGTDHLRGSPRPGPAVELCLGADRARARAPR